MDTKSYLKRAMLAQAEISYLREQIQYLREKIMNVGGVVNDDMKVQTSKSYDTMGDTVASICDREEELKEKMDAYAKIERKVSEKIDEVKEQKYRDLLRYRYILGLTYDQIADRMSYSTRHIARMHDKAVEAFEQVHGGNYT